MKLVIHAHALRNEPLSQVITGQFDERGGTIGRSDTNTLALPDPERHVSRLQAEVNFTGAAFSIRNAGSANPIEVNGRAIKPGESSPLAAGDRLVIGGYSMRVAAGVSTGASGAGSRPRVQARTVISSSAAEPRTDPRPKAAPRVQAPPPPPPAATPPDTGYETTAPARKPFKPSADPFADLIGGPAAATGDDPFADLMSSPSAPAASPVPPSRPAAPAPAAPARLPDDFDPFAQPPASARPGDVALEGFMDASPAPPGQLPVDLGMDDLLGVGGGAAPGAGGGASLDDMFGLGEAAKPGAARSDPLDDFLAPQRTADKPAGEDLLGLFGDTSAGAPSSPPSPNHTPELASAYRPPAVQGAAAKPAARTPSPPVAAPPPAAPPHSAAPLPAPASPPRAAAPHAAAAAPEALWRAFCDGAGLSLSLPQGLNPEMMRQMGRMMHHAVEGMLKLIAVRAAAKQELRAQVTTIQSRHNNPLKFSADAQAALTQLLQPPMRGFLAGPDAVRDAMDDLLGHGIGTMTGTRAALEGMLNRFEPARLEARLSGKGVMDTLLPMNRRARLWELYLEHYGKVQEDAQEDFHELFGKAFVKAYEEQLERLEVARRKAE